MAFGMNFEIKTDAWWIAASCVEFYIAEVNALGMLN